MSVKEALATMKKLDKSVLPVKAEGKVRGTISKKSIMHKLVKSKVQMADTIEECIVKDLRSCSGNISCAELGRILNRNQYVLVYGDSMIDCDDLLAFMQCKMNPVSAKEEEHKADTPSEAQK